MKNSDQQKPADSIQILIDGCLASQHKLTKWEREIFVPAMARKHPGRALSEREEAKLREIFSKTVPRQRLFNTDGTRRR